MNTNNTTEKITQATEALKTEWEVIGQLCSDFTDEDWDQATDCPLWSVKDNLSHIIGTELFLLGKELPTIELKDESMFKNDIAKMNELWIEERRNTSGEEILQEFKEVTKSRLEILANLSEEEWIAEGPTPVGMAPYFRFMEVRVLDCWMHEQDIRQALSKPGNQEGMAVEIMLNEVTKAMGFVVGKKGGAPDGCKVEFDLTGPVMRNIKIQVDGKRAGVVDDFVEPDIKIQTDTMTFTRLIGGRVKPEEVIDALNISSSNEFVETRENIINNLNYMI